MSAELMVSGTGKSDTLDIAHTSDQLEYVADMLLELRSVADRCGCETLAGLLLLSHAELLRQSNRLKP